MKIEQIIKESKLIKDDSVKVYKYKNKYIIKRKDNSEINFKDAKVEKDFLDYAVNKGIKIHNILHIIQKESFLYIVYKLVEKKGDLDYIKIGENFRKLHGLKKEFDFSKGNDDDFNFEGGENELNKILGKEILEKWNKIKQEIIEKYERKNLTNKGKYIVHGDFDFGNIIAPDIIIDTEEMKMGIPEDDILAFFRMGYRYGHKDEMQKILKGYGYKGTFDDIKDYFYYKDLTVTNWLIINNKGDNKRIKDIKNRIENWYIWEYKWVLYS